MLNNHKQDIQMLLFSTSAVTLLFLYHQYKIYAQMLKDLPGKAIQRWKQIKNNQNNTKFVLIKDRFKYQHNSWQSQFAIGSNMLFFNRIPIHKIRRAHQNYVMMNLQCKRVKLQQYPVQVFIPEIDYKLISTKKISYTGIFDSKQKPGLFGTIIKYTMATLAFVGNLFFQIISEDRKVQPAIDGPMWGKLTLMSQLISDRPFVLLCEVQDKKLIPLFAGLNKQDIYRWVQNEKVKCVLGMSLALFFLIKTHSGFVRAIGSLWQDLKEQFQIRWLNFPNRINSSYNAKVGDQQCCIICYNQCRNIIFRKCKHLILCNRCMKQNKVQNCPMCRVNIEDQLIKVVSYPQ